MHRTENYLVLNVSSVKGEKPSGGFHLRLYIGAPGSFRDSRCPGCISDQLEMLGVESKWEFSWNPSGNCNALARQRATVLLIETTLKSVSKTFCLQSLNSGPNLGLLGLQKGGEKSSQCFSKHTLKWDRMGCVTRSYPGGEATIRQWWEGPLPASRKHALCWPDGAQREREEEREGRKPKA